jgi:hypothetical protein
MTADQPTAAVQQAYFARGNRVRIGTPVFILPT